jgi:phenylpyruvate tautomerase PptA (4-oxalocrotonate tautomerase family)
METSMPLVRIDLMKGKSASDVRAMADGVHQALVETFSVPADDRFQVITQHEPGSLIFDPHYMGIERTDDVVFIQILASNWRDTATKQRLYRRIVELLTERPGLRPEDVLIALSPNDRPDWSFGNGIAQYVKDAANAAQ